MVISGSQHPLKVDYRIPKYIIQLWVNKILVVVVMVTLLEFNVKIEKSILKYFIDEESSNVILLDAISVGADIYLEIGERRCKMGDFALREAFDLLQNGRKRWDSITQHRKDKANSWCHNR